MVGVKLVIVLMVIAIGGYLILTVYGTSNWHPFAPYGYTGVSFFGKTIFGQTASGGRTAGHVRRRGDHLLRLYRI